MCPCYWEANHSDNKVSETPILVKDCMENEHNTAANFLNPFEILFNCVCSASTWFCGQEFSVPNTPQSCRLCVLIDVVPVISKLLLNIHIDQVCSFEFCVTSIEPLLNFVNPVAHNSVTNRDTSTTFLGWSAHHIPTERNPLFKLEIKHLQYWMIRRIWLEMWLKGMDHEKWESLSLETTSSRHSIWEYDSENNCGISAKYLSMRKFPTKIERSICVMR